jgi:hypothetical protein
MSPPMTNKINPTKYQMGFIPCSDIGLLDYQNQMFKRITAIREITA